MGIGIQSLVRRQPFHSMLYMMNRAGADTLTAAFVARSSIAGHPGLLLFHYLPESLLDFNFNFSLVSISMCHFQGSESSI